MILNQHFSNGCRCIEKTPTLPVILDLTESQINNLLIIKKPKEKEEEGSSSKNILDFNELDINMLEENKLDEDELIFGRLDFNLLDVDLLANILDALNRKIFYKTIESFPTNPIDPNSYEEGNTQIVRDGEWLIYRQFDNRIVQITIGEDSQTQIQLNQTGSNVTLTLKKTLRFCHYY